MSRRRRCGALYEWIDAMAPYYTTYFSARPGSRGDRDRWGDNHQAAEDRRLVRTRVLARSISGAVSRATARSICTNGTSGAASGRWIDLSQPGVESRADRAPGHSLRADAA